MAYNPTQPQGYYPDQQNPFQQTQYPPQQYPPQPYAQPYAPQAYPPQPYAQPYPVQADYSVPPPLAPEPIHHAHESIHTDKFPERPVYRDVIFAILFLIQLGGVIVVLIFGRMKGDDIKDDSSSSSSAADFLPHNDLGKVYICCIAGAAAAFVFAVLWLAIMKKFARQLIIFTLIASIVWCIVLAVVSFALGSVAGGIVFALLAVLSAVCFWFWRSRIPFATAVLKTVAHILQAYPAPTYYAYTSLIVQCVWLAVWVIAFTWVQSYDSAPAAGLSIFLIFSFYWTGQVIKNVVHVTASGLYATWYFMSGGVGMPENPTHKAFKRAVTTSFGSICLGSLLVAILKTLRTLVEGARRNNGNNILYCLAACILNVLDSLLRYFNMYAFAQVAIYGKRYCEAATDTWELIKTSGISAIVNDNLISGVLTMGAILGGASSAVVGALVASAIADEYWASIAFVCFLIGIALVMVTMEVVESGVCTIFVCFAMDPHALQRNDPELYTKFVTTYKGMHV